MTSQPFSFKKRGWSQLNPKNVYWGKGGVKTRTKEGGWIYYLNNSKEIVLIALHILCDGKTTVLKGWGGGVRIDMYRSESFYGGKGRGRRGRGRNFCYG